MGNRTASGADDAVIPRYYKPTPAGRSTLTRERIRQIETIALRKVRRELTRRGIGKADLIA